MTFMSNLKETLNEDFNVSVTENGAIGYKTTGKELLDLNFKVSSLRSKNEEEIINIFTKAFYEDKMLAMKWLFFASDVRGGLGERRLFRICIKWLGENYPEIVKNVIELVPEYSRWDNILCLLDSPLRGAIVKFIRKTLAKDEIDMANKRPISLLAKWLPSVSTSSKITCKMAKELAKELGMTERQYRKTLSKLRAYLKVVETYMSERRWHEIEYAAVPSRANLIYNSAFMKHDEERRTEYLNSLQKGETKINAGVLFPHDIVTRYCNNNIWHISTQQFDTTLEELWKSLPDYVNETGNTICVADGSGSMRTCVGNTKTTALDVANALAIYFAERSSGQFKNTYITFSEHPKLVDMSKCTSLKDKLNLAYSHNEVADTNIEKVFDLILQTAINKNMRQDELPQNILILSDMEFNGCVVIGDRGVYKPDEKLFQTFARRYAEHGYKLPRLVFWNICSKTGTIPLKQNELGVALVSGFSPTIVSMVLSNETDPFKCLVKQLSLPRYDAVEEALKPVLI